MRKTFTLLALIVLSCPLFAQTKASLKGTLVDSISKTPLEFATVALVNAKDSSLISYTLSIKSGAFKLTGLPVERPTRLIISYAGYSTFRKQLVLKPGDLDLGQISLSGKLLSEVTVRGDRSPVVRNKDTLTFNTEAFKTRPNANVEELLRLLPGIQVNFDGTLEVNGRGTNKLLVDGKRFFGDDARVTTKNLDAAMIDKVQIYDDRDEDPDHKLSDAQVGKIINLKMKKSIKTSTMGKVFAGSGSRDRYEGGAILSNFRDTLQVSLMGSSNNLNSTGFSSNELYTMGGLNRSQGGQAYDGTFGGRSRAGLERVTTAGVNINNNYGKELKLNLAYYYTDARQENRNTSYNEQTLPTTLLTSASSSNAYNNNQRHSITGLVEWIPDTLRRFRFDPRLGIAPSNGTSNSFGNSFNTQNPRVTETVGNNYSNSNNVGFSYYSSFYIRSKNKKRSLNITHNLNLNNTSSNSFNYSNTIAFTSALNAQLIDRFADRNTTNNVASMDLNYNQRINKSAYIEIYINSRYLTDINNETTFDRSNLTKQYDSLSANLSRDQKRYWFIQNFKPQLSVDLAERINVRLGADAEFQKVENRFGAGYANKNQQLWYLFPVFQANIKDFSTNYYEYIDQPQTEQLQPIRRVYNQSYEQIGNPDLAPSRIRNLQFSFNKYITDKQFSYYANVGSRLIDNAVVYRNLIDSVGRTTSTYVNRSGNWGINGNIRFTKQFKKQQKWQVSASTNLGASASRNAFFLNADEGKQADNNIYASQSINLTYGPLLNMSASYSINARKTNYVAVNYPSVNTLTHSAGTGFNLRWPSRVIFDGRYAFNYNTLTAPGIPKSANILSLSVNVQMLKKDRGMVKLTCYDILDQNISVYRYASANALNTSENMILRRYFLLTYHYKLTNYK